MQIAYKNAERTADRRVFLRDIKPGQLDAVHNAGFTWNKSKKYFEGIPSLFMLEALSQLVRLPASLENLKAQLKENQESINTERTLSKDKVQEHAIAPVKAKLYAHQVKALNMALERFKAGEGFGLLFEMGCGKTLTAIAIAGALFLRKKIERVLVVCPSSIVSVWQKDVAQFADFPYSIRAIQGKKADRIKALEEIINATIAEPPLIFAVINYESVHREGIFEALQAYNADLIICDESQRIKSHNAAQSKAMHKLGDKAKYKLILSGTPLQNSAIDIYSQYRFLDPSIFGKNFFAFKARYTIAGGFQNKQIVGYRDLDDLIKKAHSIAYRVTKNECLDLPEQIFINREVDLEPSAEKLYLRLKTDSLAELETGETVTAQTVLTKILRLQQFTGGFISDDEGNIEQVSSAKLDTLKEILEDYLPSGGKAVIFARFTAELKAIKKLLQDLGIGYGFIDGSVALEQRGAIVDKFQKDPEIKIFIAQIATAGLGITLTAASLSIFYSYGYNYADYSQALARTHRIGQKEKCTYINLVCKGTIDAKVLKALEQKENTAKAIVDNWRAYFE